MDRSMFERLLTQAALLVGASSLVQIRAGGYYLQFTEAFGMGTEFDDSIPRCVLTADIGRLEENTKVSVMEFALAYNYAWELHGGLRVALDSARDRVALMLDVPLPDMTAQELADVLSRFRDAVLAWREALVAMAESGGAGDRLSLEAMSALKV